MTLSLKLNNILGPLPSAFSAVGNFSKCRLTRAEHRKWASVLWPSQEPLHYSFQKLCSLHWDPPSPLPALVSKIGRRSNLSTLAWGPGWVFPGPCFVALITIFTMKVKKETLERAGRSPHTCGKGFLSCKWEQLCCLAHWPRPPSPAPTLHFKGLSLRGSHILLDDKLIKFYYYFFFLNEVDTKTMTPQAWESVQPSGSD